jgi:hypothetical protein
VIQVRHESEDFYLAFTVLRQMASKQLNSKCGSKFICSAINDTLFYERSRDFCDSNQSANMSCTKAEIGVR